MSTCAETLCGRPATRTVRIEAEDRTRTGLRERLVYPSCAKHEEAVRLTVTKLCPSARVVVHEAAPAGRSARGKS